jgi:hypothetical protein
MLEMSSMAGAGTAQAKYYGPKGVNPLAPLRESPQPQLHGDDDTSRAPSIRDGDLAIEDRKVNSAFRLDAHGAAVERFGKDTAVPAIDGAD